MSEHDSDERWLPVRGFEGLYEVSDQGRVRSLDRKIVGASGRVRWFPGRPVKGYRRVQGNDVRWVITLRDGVRNEKHFLYVLVLEAFDSPRPAPEIDARHLDGNTDNNALSNLAWGTRAENMQDSLRHGTNEHARRTHCPRKHPLEVPNLCPTKQGNHRQCLACNRAASAVRSAQRRGLQPPDFVEESDRQFASLMAEPGKRQGKAVGEAAANAIMTDEKVRAMRADHAAGMTYADMCARYSVKKSQVWNIVARKSWKHVA